MAQATATVKTKPNMGTARTGRTIEETAAQQASLIRKRMEDAGKQTDRFKEITAQMAAAVKSGDLDKVRSLTTTFADVRASFVANSKDLASAMFGLGAEFKEIGVLIEELQALSPEEQKLINDAEALQKRMEGRLSNANAELAKAENKTAIFGFRRRARKRVSHDRRKGSVRQKPALPLPVRWRSSNSVSVCSRSTWSSPCRSCR